MRWQGVPGQALGPAIWAAAAGCLILAAFFWYDAFSGEEQAEAPQQQLSAPPLLAGQEFHLPAPPPAEAYRAVLERPLFHPGRRPFADRSAIAAAERSARAAEAQKAPAAPPPPVLLAPPQGVTLRGTIVSGPFRSAIFERTGRKDYVRIEEGGVLEGWTLTKVSRAGVLFKGGGRELEIKLEPGLR